MTEEQKQVTEFMVKAGQAAPATPTMPDFDVRFLRVKLIMEELAELADAFGFDLVLDTTPKQTGNLVAETHGTNMVEAYDAILDLMVVVIGTGVAMGLDLKPGWEEVHKSNMAKFGAGGRKREDGKWLKPPGWQPPRLEPIIEAQQNKQA